MAQKSDPKDDRIAELELQLETANESIGKAESAAQEIPALKSQIETQAKTIKERDTQIAGLQKELQAARDKAGDSGKATITDLDPAKAVQLSVSSMVTNAITKQPETAVAGSILVIKEAFDEVSKKVGTAAKVYPVSKDEIEAAKQNRRAY